MRIFLSRQRIQVTCIAASSLLLVNCSKSSSSTDAAALAASSTTTSTTTTSTDTDVTTTNALALAYPSSLSVSVFPQSTSASALRGSKLTDPLPAQEDLPKVETFKEKQETAEAILKGEGDSCLPEIFQKNLMDQSVTCYQFDQEMMYASQGSQTAGTKTGLDSAGESCLVSFARSQISTVNAIVDQALGFVQAMMCQAKKSGSATLPAVGESLDLATEIGTAMGTYASTVTKATISRLKDQNGQPVYRSDVELAMKMNQGGTNKTLTTEMHLVHSPVSETSNDTYTGKLWVKRAGAEAGALPGGGQNQNPVDNYLSVSYAKVKEADASYRLITELRRAQLNSVFSDLAFVNGALDLNAGASFSGGITDGSYVNPTTQQPIQDSNSAIAGIMYVAFNVNPADNTGAVSYWQNPGGSYTEQARGMIFSLSADADTGLLKGCGLSGATGRTSSNLGSASIRQFMREGKALDRELQPNGFFHPMFNIEGTPNTGCTRTGLLTDADGSYYSSSCVLGGNTQVSKWYKPDFSNVTDTVLQAAATTWVTDQMGDYVSKQCVVQGSDGVYAIDTALTTTNAGFELVKNDTSVSAPDLSGVVSVDVADAP